MIHTDLADGRWFTLSLAEQLSNVGCDIDRAIRWRNKGDLEHSHNAFLRALELISLTIIDSKHKFHRKELTRVREAILDYFMGDNEYGSTDEAWHNYFMTFNYIYALQKGR